MQLNGECAGCGVGPKADCPILRYARKESLDFCAQCKGYPCPRIKKGGKFGDAWLEKLAEEPVPEA